MIGLSLVNFSESIVREEDLTRRSSCSTSRWKTNWRHKINNWDKFNDLGFKNKSISGFCGFSPKKTRTNRTEAILANYNSPEGGGGGKNVSLPTATTHVVDENKRNKNSAKKCKPIFFVFQRNLTPVGSPVHRGSTGSSLTSPLPNSSSTCLPGADSGGSGGNCETNSTASPVVSPHNHNISGNDGFNGIAWSSTYELSNLVR